MNIVKIGRWIYCKYCYKSVKPELGGIYQIVCPECNSGLTPDFASAKGLETYLETGCYHTAKTCNDETIARKEIFQALRNGEEILQRIKIKDDKIIVDNHVSQPYARAISELAIKNEESKKK